MNGRVRRRAGGTRGVNLASVVLTVTLYLTVFPPISFSVSALKFPNK